MCRYSTTINMVLQSMQLLRLLVPQVPFQPAASGRSLN